jgi:hypothetical protein
MAGPGSTVALESPRATRLIRVSANLVGAGGGGALEYYLHTHRLIGAASSSSRRGWRRPT